MALPQTTGWFRLGADPDVRRLDEGGVWVAAFSGAANKTFRNKRGDEVKKTTWLRCVAWHEVAEQLARAELRKGSLVWLRGELEQEKYTDDSGTERESYQLLIREVHLPAPYVARRGGAGGGVAPGPDPGAS